MSGEAYGAHEMTFNAAGDLSAKQYHFCKMTADYTVGAAGAAAADVIGVIQDNNANAAGKAVAVRSITEKSTRIVCGAAIAVGTRVTPNAAGRAVAATTGQPFYGILAEASGADGDIIEMQFALGVMP